MELGVHFGPSLWWWQLLLPPSAVLHLTLTLMASRSFVHLLKSPSCLMVNHLDIRQHRGLGPLEVQSWVSKKLVPRGRGGLFQNVTWDLVALSSSATSSFITHHSFPQLQTEFYHNGDVERRLQASTNGNSTVTEKLWQAACFYKASINERLELKTQMKVCVVTRVRPPCVILHQL